MLATYTVHASADGSSVWVLMVSVRRLLANAALSACWPHGWGGPDDSGGNGGGPGLPPEPPPREAASWLAFEREFAAHVGAGWQVEAACR